MGKKILQPGKRAATEQLFVWANFQPDQTVLRLASSFGDRAIALAQQYGVKVVGVEKNPESIACVCASSRSLQYAKEDCQRGLGMRKVFQQYRQK